MHKTMAEALVWFREVDIKVADVIVLQDTSHNGDKSRTATTKTATRQNGDNKNGDNCGQNGDSA